MKISVSIVDDDDGLRRSLRRLLERCARVTCVSDHGSTAEALERLPAVRPQVVLMDVHLPGMEGPEAVRRLKPLLPDTEFIMLTVHEDTQRIFEALAAGASGYLLKTSEFAEIEAAILQVHQGGAPMSSHIARKVVGAFRDPSPARPAESFQELTPREREILELLSRGFLYKEIAAELGVTYHTVNNHVRHVYEKLHVNSRGEAVARYYEARRSPR